MKEQKDHHLEAPGEANRDKHINFLAGEMGDVNSADENFDNAEESDDNKNEVKDIDNGFFTDDDSAETKASTKRHKNPSNSSEKVIPVVPDAAQAINDNVQEGDNNDALIQSGKAKGSKKEDDQAH